MPYDPHNWFWIVGGDESRWYSSAAGSYVPPQQSFLDAGNRPTKIANEAELWDVLAAAGIENTAAILNARAKKIADDPFWSRVIETIFRALKSKNPSMTIPSRDDVIQAWKDSI